MRMVAMLAHKATCPDHSDYDFLMKSRLRCVVCRGALAGKQRRFCSRACKNRDTNHRHQSYACQQQRGLQRKVRLVAEAGGRCGRCGYDRNLAALAWHHVVPATKSFTLDLRSLSNRCLADITLELAKCELLCANCHAETHFPELAIDKVSFGRSGPRTTRAKHLVA